MPIPPVALQHKRNWSVFRVGFTARGSKRNSLEGVSGNVSGQRRAEEEDSLRGLLGGTRAVEGNVRVCLGLVGVGLLAAGGDSKSDLCKAKV